ncbi:hypothetical protein [Aquimarina algiphila]|uniref:hypothetical protein n=1 Tax=Aquimarina algiphila TaxID=2047982 RepID=UPI00249182C4|nr:hypothetical protein [Aquimarina algiphila]
MGKIVCQNHGEQGIFQISKNLNLIYNERKKQEKIIRLLFKIEEINNEIDHFFLITDDISGFPSIMDTKSFEKEYVKISGDPIICITCFKNYIQKNNIEIVDKIIRVME